MLGIAWDLVLPEEPREQIAVLELSYVFFFVSLGVVFGSALSMLR